MKSIFFVIAVVAAGFGWFYLLQFFRVKSMRSLASRLGFNFIGRPLPASFTMTCYPFDGNLGTIWNVIEGQRNGTRVLVFDSTVWGNYRTFIAVQKEGELFTTDGSYSSGKV